MTTLTTVRDDLRTELKDTDATAYRWTDAELNRHIARAVQEYSRASPRERKTTIATTSAVRTLDITGITGYSDLIKLYAVEWPVDKLPALYSRFSYWNGIVTFLATRPTAPTATCTGARSTRSTPAPRPYPKGMSASS